MSNLLNGRYRPVKILSSGGFGMTFLAEDTHMPSGRICVGKRLLPQMEDPQFIAFAQERFNREAACLEQLGNLSDQIPTLYAYFR